MTLPKLLWKPSPNFSARSARVDLVVLHDTEGSYGSAINTFLNPHSMVSSHYVIREDGGEATQFVALADKAWSCRDYNSRSVNIEMAGHAAIGYSPALLAAAAEIAAYLCHHLQVPVVHARGGVGPGIASHYDLGRPGGSHADPSTDPNFMPKFVTLVQSAYAKGDFPTWEAG